MIRFEVDQLHRWRTPRPFVTLGVFDGVHRGHAAVVRAAVDAARRRGGRAVVLTFDPHPRALVGQPPAAIATLEQRLDALAALGVDGVCVIRFDQALASEEAHDFARRVLWEGLAAAGVFLGRSARFGRGRLGDAESLALWARSTGATVECVPPVLLGGEPASSTRIREAVADAKLDLAAGMAGRAFTLRGEVVPGRQLARRLGLPTMNMRLPPSRLCPPAGVYAGRLRPARDEASLPPPRLDDPRADVSYGTPLHLDAWDEDDPSAAYDAVVNVGPPHDGGPGENLVEAHAFGLSGDYYGWTVELAFGDLLRPPQRFADQDAARWQLARDARAARDWLALAAAKLRHGERG